MATIRIIYDVAGWAYHARATALRKYAPPDLQIETAVLARAEQMESALGVHEPDIVFVLSQPMVPRVRQALNARCWRSKLIASWNSGWPLQIDRFYISYAEADAVVINNATAWERVGRLPRTYLLPNGVDRTTFRIDAPLNTRRPLVLWTGSELGRRRKGYDQLVRPLQDSLCELGIECDLWLVNSYGDAKRAPFQMAEWYNTGTVLVCASSVEGTPNPALEAAACGCTIVSTPVGNMPELIRDGVNGYLVERRLEALVAGVRAACRDYPRLSAAMQDDIAAWDWRERSLGFYQMFREVLSPPARAAAKPPDFSDRLTVFVTTIGAPSYAACRLHLAAQDCGFRLQVIERVAPMNAAFQRMLDDCPTPFFVQVDEDMLLYPHAVRTLYECIVAAGDSAAIVARDLYDAHLGRCIIGVKIYRHDIVRRYPFGEVQSFEKLQVQQLNADGYEVFWPALSKEPDPDRTLGLHGTHWTAESIYERYATLESRRRRHPQQLAWFEEYHSIFLQRVLEDPSEVNFFALMGLLSAMLPQENGAGSPKDYRSYEALPGLRSARALFEEVRRR